MRIFRRFAAAVLLLALMCGACAAGEDVPELRGYSKTDGYVYLTLGRFPQTADGGIEPILWRVLAVDDEKAYLCSEYVLLARCMHADLKEYRDVLKGDFSRTDLCAYLNGEFTETAFTADELEMLLPCENFGKVFLLTADDMQNKSYGLGLTHVGKVNSSKITEEPGLRAWGTEWATQNNGFDPKVYTDPHEKLVGSSNKKMPLAELRLYVFRPKFGSHSPYWARTASTSDGRHARCVKDGGQLGHIEVGRDNEGVRPALYLALDKYVSTGGTGTKDDPYVLAYAGGTDESGVTEP